MREKDNLHCSPVPSMHTFDETTRNLHRVIFSFSAHFFLVYLTRSCLRVYLSQTPFAFSSLFAYSYSIPPHKLRNGSSSCSASAPLFVVMPVEDVPNLGPMMRMSSDDGVPFPSA